MMTELLVLSTVCGGVAVFLAVWAVGDWLTSWRRDRLAGMPIWIPPHVAPYLERAYVGVRAEEEWGSVVYDEPAGFVEFVSPLGDAQGVIRVPRDIAHLFAVPEGWAPRVEVTPR